MTESLREDLTALVDSPGWRWLVQAARRECQIRKDSGMRAAADELADAVAVGKFRQVLAFETGVEMVLRMPREQLTRLPAETPVGDGAPLSRRGPL